MNSYRITIADAYWSGFDKDKDANTILDTSLKESPQQPTECEVASEILAEYRRVLDEYDAFLKDEERETRERRAILPPPVRPSASVRPSVSGEPHAKKSRVTDHRTSTRMSFNVDAPSTSGVSSSARVPTAPTRPTRPATATPPRLAPTVPAATRSISYAPMYARSWAPPQKRGEARPPGWKPNPIMLTHDLAHERNLIAKPTTDDGMRVVIKRQDPSSLSSVPSRAPEREFHRDRLLGLTKKALT